MSAVGLAIKSANNGSKPAFLAIWALVSYGFSIFFIEWLNEIKLGQLPLGFWFAQQGAIYVFVILIFVYIRLMNKLDKKYNLND